MTDMKDLRYSNRELDGKFQGFLDKFSEFDKDMRESNSRIELEVEEVKKQAITTNGRVKNLELWRAASMGAIGVIITLLLPVLGWSMYTLLQVDQKIHNEVKQTLKESEIQVVTP